MDTVPLKPIEDFDGYWAALHESLSVDYTLPNDLIDLDMTGETGAGGRVEADCEKIAARIGEGLAARGLRPSLLFIASQAIGASRGKLRPKIFGGRIEWTCHLVCEAGGLVYDPVFPGPLPESEYLAGMFDEAITVNTAGVFAEPV